MIARHECIATPLLRTNQTHVKLMLYAKLPTTTTSIQRVKSTFTCHQYPSHRQWNTHVDDTETDIALHFSFMHKCRIMHLSIKTFC